MRVAGAALVLMLAASVLGPVPAGADAASHQDPPGDNLHGNESAILDIAELEHDHDTQRVSARPYFLVHRVTTYDEWENSILPLGNEGGDGSISLEFEVDGRRAVVGLERNEDGSIFGTMTAGGANGFGGFSAYVRAWRPDDRTVAVSLPISALSEATGRHVRAYGWNVVTVDRTGCSYATSHDTLSACDDRAPDDVGMLHHAIAQCEDGIDNDGDGEVDKSDIVCVWPGQLFEDEAEVETSIVITGIRKAGGGVHRIRGRVRHVAIRDAGARYRPRFATCIAGRELSLRLLRRGRVRPFGTTSTDGRGRWRVGIRFRKGRTQIRAVMDEIRLGVAETDADDIASCSGAISPPATHVAVD